MLTRKEELGTLVREIRETKKLSQDDVVRNCGVETNRSAVAHLEQGVRLPKPRILEAICSHIGVPQSYWQPFTDERSLRRLEFEEVLSELVGHVVSLDSQDSPSQRTAEAQINRLLTLSPSRIQLYELFSSVLVYYGVGPISRPFFDNYFDLASFGSIDAFRRAVERYQMDAVRLFSTFTEAFEKLSGQVGIDSYLQQLRPRETTPYQERTDWDQIETIDDERLPDLGYISAKQVRQESAERTWLVGRLNELADSLRTGKASALDSIPEKSKRKIDSLLRKFDSTIRHGVSSPMFAPDYDALSREAQRLSPRNEQEIQRMEDTQQKGLRNLSRYLAADHMDVYLATSMRTKADYVSVSRFASALFSHERIRPLKLRHFNPTQSWIDDRVAKGLVEALMLKRASVTIYLAQKSDSFGKDSEASVALGQGKPVLVYVPKLNFSGSKDLDSEEMFSRPRSALLSSLAQTADSEEIDDTIDDEALVGRLLTHTISSLPDEAIAEAVARVWADFDLYSEDGRFPEAQRKPYRKWLDTAIASESAPSIPPELRPGLVGLLVATAINFEKRAKMFREIHPLALQVILSTGVLNGILVARSVEQCASVLDAIIRNELDLQIHKDEDNYRIVESSTKSTIRVISRHQLLRHAFEAFYRRQVQTR